MPVDERAALQEDLQKKRERLQQDATRHRDVRDRLNDQTKRHALRRDEFNAQVRALVDEANRHKARRDELNAKVREAKKERDALNRDAQEKSEALGALRRERGQGGGPPIGKLRAEIRRLEFEQQTKALPPKDEKKLIDLISAKQNEVRQREAAMQENDELRAAYETMREAKAAAEAQHQAVTLLAAEAQGEHDAMVRLFNEADGVRKQADAGQGDFVRSKQDADKEHRAYIAAVMAIRDVERVLAALRAGARGAEPTAQHADARAEEIFDRFRKGGKLSTEDLMALQKAGRL